MERKVPQHHNFWNKNALKAPNGGVSRVGYQLVRMRSPVQIWVAAPTFKHRKQWFSVLFVFLCNDFAVSVIVTKGQSEGKTDTETDTDKKNKLGRVLSLSSFLYGLPHDLSGLADAFLVSVGIHPQGHGLVTMAQGL